MKVYLETFGCQMNKLDSELIAGRIAAAGWELTDDAKAADVVLMNTCSVRQHAENKVHSRIGLHAKRKAAGKNVVIAVVGCMAQRLGGELAKQYPQLDVVCGPSEIDRLLELIAAASGGDGQQLAVAPTRKTRSREFDRASTDRLDGLDLSRPTRSAGRQAYVRVQRGCDKFCAYCVVPEVRGGEQSRNPDAVVEEVRKLTEAGVVEVTLLGQTVNSYRYGSGGATTTLADLLARLDGTPGLRRLRFVTSYPSDFSRELMQAMRDLPSVCEYLHMPAQSGSDAVLRAMNRRYTVAEYLEIIDATRETAPGITVASDFIVGFSGETEDDFQASCDLIRRAAFKNSFIFKYSVREGTAAARRLVDDVPEPVKRRRNNELLAVQNEVSTAHHRAMVGRIEQVLVEGRSVRSEKQPTPAPDGQVQLTGRTRGDHIVVFDGPEAIVGEFVDVQIEDCTALALMGKRA